MRASFYNGMFVQKPAMEVAICGKTSIYCSLALFLASLNKIILSNADKQSIKTCLTGLTHRISLNTYSISV